MDTQTSDFTAAEMQSVPEATESWRRDPGLWAALSCTLVLKLAMIALQLSIRRAGWLNAAHADLRAWGDFTAHVNAGGVPYVDFACDAPALTVSLYWLLPKLAKFFELPGPRPLVSCHAAIMAVVDLLNVCVFYRLARAVEPRSALRASLVFVGGASVLVLGPTHIDGLVIACLLAAYLVRERPGLSAAFAGLGAGFDVCVAFLLFALELQRFAVSHDGRRWLRTIPVFAAVQLALYAPFLAAAYRAHQSFSLQLSFLPLVQNAADTPLGLITLWSGAGVTPAFALIASAGLGVWAWVYTVRRNLSEPARFVVLAVALLVLYPARTATWQFWLYPFLILIALRAFGASRAWLLWLYALLDVATVLGGSIFLGPARKEFGGFEPHAALDKGAVWTLLWTTAVVCKVVLLWWVARDLARGAVAEEPAPARLEWPRFERARWTAWFSRPTLAAWVVGAFIVVQTFATSAATRDMGEYSDEVFHGPQIERFCHGDRKLDEGLTTFPGYHAVSAVIANWRGDCSRAAVRQQNAFWGFAATLFAFLILAALGSQQVPSRTLGYHFLPLLFPYLFVVYTDVLALAIALFAFTLMVKRWFAFAGVVGAISIGVRQTNALVLLLIALVALLDEDKSRPVWDWVKSYIKKTWTCALGLLAFAVFIYRNGGVALGDKSSHVPGLHIGNVVLLLFLLGLLALPVNIERVWRERRALASGAFLFSLTALYFAYVYLFKVEHPYNTHDRFMRNEAVMWATQNVLTKALFFAPVAFGFAVLWVTPLVRSAYWAWVPVALVAILPEALIEQRYALVPLTLWSLFRRDGSGFAETLTAIVNVIVSTLLVRLISTGSWRL